ncbi:hypothetical protein B5E84_03250 [Lachnoclostridium sp. An14]|nr:hypothetical protein B5E84_03250 [Lachnoclostridium sp. An14]
MLPFLPDQPDLDLQRLFQRNSLNLRHRLRNVPKHKPGGDSAGYKFLYGVKLTGIVNDVGLVSRLGEPFLDHHVLIKPLVEHHQRFPINLLNGNGAVSRQGMAGRDAENRLCVRHCQNVVGLSGNLVDGENGEIQHALIQKPQQVFATSLPGV